jgi:hypothetical protein
MVKKNKCLSSLSIGWRQGTGFPYHILYVAIRNCFALSQPQNFPQTRVSSVKNEIIRVELTRIPHT